MQIKLHDAMIDEAEKKLQDLQAKRACTSDEAALAALDKEIEEAAKSLQEAQAIYRPKRVPRAKKRRRY